MPFSVTAPQPKFPLQGALLLCLLAFTSGCASVTGNGRRQTVFIQSSPPGASISVDQKVVGRTPRFIEINRAREVNVSLASKDHRINVPLTTSYRWGRSFLGNLGFLIYAPIGWTWDFVSGAAWEVSDSPIVSLNLTPEDQAAAKESPRLKEAAIAPPLARTLGLSDAGALALEERLRGPGGSPSIVKPYQETLPAFLRVGFDYDLPAKDRRALYGRIASALGTDVIYESTATERDDEWLIRSTAINVYTNEQTPGPTVALESPDAVDRLIAGPRWWTRLIPNTVGLDLENDRVEISQRGTTYQFLPVESDQWPWKALGFINAITLTNVPSRRREHTSQWSYSAVPAFRFSQRYLKGTKLPAPVSGEFGEAEPRFDRTLLIGGYGLELGYQYGRHFFYADLIPLFFWSEIKWQEGGRDKSATATGLTGAVEAGYLVFFDQNWVMRLYSRTITENTDLWREALASRLPASNGEILAERLSVGLSLAYRFEPRFHTRTITE